MPIVYGEGRKVFVKLQEEIMKVSDDKTIFAWLDPGACESTYRGLLASSPSEFTWYKKSLAKLSSANTSSHIRRQTRDFAYVWKSRRTSQFRITRIVCTLHISEVSGLETTSGLG